MTSSLGIIIRDALESDILNCLQINTVYEADHAWQMNIQQLNNETRITFRQERLPYSINFEHHVDKSRLKFSLGQEHCYLVIEEKSSRDLLGYLTMRAENVYQTAYIQDIVIEEDARRHGLGMRLLRAGQRWAMQHDVHKLIAEIQMKNYPAIEFIKQAGFTFCGYNDRYFPNQEIAVLFAQSLV